MNLRGSIAGTGAWLVTVLGAAGWFLMTTATFARSGKPLVLFAGLLGLALGMLLTLQPSAWRSLRLSVVPAVLGGVLAFWAAPALVLSQRSSDAPPGTETLMFSVVGFGLVVVFAAAISRDSRPAPSAWAAAVVGAAGAAGLLANWERPSSFSPLVRWPGREGLMIAAGVLFAVGTLLILHAEKRSGRQVRVVAVFSAGTAGLLFAIPSLLAGEAVTLNFGEWVLLGVTYAMFGSGWLSAARRLGPAPAASALIVVPAALTTLIVVERAWGVRGPDPIVWQGAAPGIAISLAGAAALLAGTHAQPAGGDAATRSSKALWWAAIGTMALAAATLLLPALSQTAQGAVVEAEAFRATWLVSGYASGSGWAVFAAAASALATALAVLRRWPARVWGLMAVAGLVCVVAFPFLGESTFATWNFWVPGDVQHAYGTEYARISATAVLHPVRVFSAALSLLVIVWSAAVGLAKIHARREEPAPEERST